MKVERVLPFRRRPTRLARILAHAWTAYWTLIAILTLIAFIAAGLAWFWWWLGYGVL